MSDIVISFVENTVHNFLGELEPLVRRSPTEECYVNVFCIKMNVLIIDTSSPLSPHPPTF